jgi:hypothetical protein
LIVFQQTRNAFPFLAASFTDRNGTLPLLFLIEAHPLTLTSNAVYR